MSSVDEPIYVFPCLPRNLVRVVLGLGCNQMRVTKFERSSLQKAAHVTGDRGRVAIKEVSNFFDPSMTLRQQ